MHIMSSSFNPHRCVPLHRSTVNFSVTVLEYRNSSFLSLTSEDLDQLLQNTPMEECTLSISTLVGKALEIDIAAETTKVVRDLSE